MTLFLLDTTYILPFCGIDVKIPQILSTLEKITSMGYKTLLISSCSLIEAKYKALRNFVKTKDHLYLDRVNLALLSFQSNRYFQVIDSWYLPDALTAADTLYLAGHKDYMDCWIAATAKVRNASLVTEDDPLKKKLETLVDWKSLRIISWQEFVEQVANP